MSLNIYSLIIKALNENNMDATLEQIGNINNLINELINRGICKEWIESNIEILL